MSKKLSKDVRDFARLSKLYDRLYNTRGVCGVQEGSIQITKQYFSELMKSFPEAIVTTRNRHNDYCPIEASLQFPDVRFFTIGTAKEFEAAGIPVPS